MNTKLNNQFNAKSSPAFDSGSSLMELLASISIIALLASVAAPSFASMIDNRQIKASSIMLSTTLTLARNHAISTTITVIVCHAKDSTMTQCSDSRKRNTNWSNGIITYADLDASNDLDSNDQILSTVKIDPKVAMVFNQNGRLRFFSDGGARSAGFYLCSRASKNERHVRILHTGRTRTKEKLSQTHRKTCLSKTV